MAQAAPSAASRRESSLESSQGGNGSRYEKNAREFESFLANPHGEFLAVSRTTADSFGRIAAALRRKGTPIPTNDIWIAAHAMESGAEPVTFDGHFAAIDGLVSLVPPAS
jgi:tRNA(fMet)-specific endonuclease VapC